MGGGKTTVITPLLALFLADGRRLVVQCVPAALLDMSRAVMRAAFASVTRKAVYTFQVSESGPLHPLFTLSSPDLSL
eukprot:scaffold24532_cov67-Isochrysis_galbana.AAC.1